MCGIRRKGLRAPPWFETHGNAIAFPCSLPSGLFGGAMASAAKTNGTCNKQSPNPRQQVARMSGRVVAKSGICPPRMSLRSCGLQTEFDLGRCRRHPSRRQSRPTPKSYSPVKQPAPPRRSGAGPRGWCEGRHLFQVGCAVAPQTMLWKMRATLRGEIRWRGISLTPWFETDRRAEPRLSSSPSGLFGRARASAAKTNGTCNKQSPNPRQQVARMSDRWVAKSGNCRPAFRCAHAGYRQSSDLAIVDGTRRRHAADAKFLFTCQTARTTCKQSSAGPLDGGARAGTSSNCNPQPFFSPSRTRGRWSAERRNLFWAPQRRCPFTP